MSAVPAVGDTLRAGDVLQDSAAGPLASTLRVARTEGRQQSARSQTEQVLGETRQQRVGQQGR